MGASTLDLLALLSGFGACEATPPSYDCSYVLYDDHWYETVEIGTRFGLKTCGALTTQMETLFPHCLMLHIQLMEQRGFLVMNWGTAK